MARQSTLLAAALLLPAAHAIRPSAIGRRDAIKAAPPAFLLASRPAWARYDDYKDGPRGLKYVVTEPGTGATPQRGQSVKAEYTLTLDGFSEDGGRVVGNPQRNWPVRRRSDCASRDATSWSGIFGESASTGGVGGIAAISFSRRR